MNATFHMAATLIGRSYMPKCQPCSPKQARDEVLSLNRKRDKGTTDDLDDHLIVKLETAYALPFAELAEIALRDWPPDRDECTLRSAEGAAEKAADQFRLPQTVYRDGESGGYWHTNPFADRLRNAEVIVTYLPANYFT